MFINKLLVITLLLAANVMAADSGVQNHNHWHTPAMEESVRINLQKQITDKRVDVGASTLSGAKKGALAPWFVTFFVGAVLNKKERPHIGDAIVGGFGTALLLSPLNLVAMIPSTAIGAVAGLGKGIVHGVRSKINEPTFNLEVAKHLYGWVAAVIEGRTAVRNMTIEWQKSHNETSIKQALKDLLKEESFTTYVAESQVSIEELERLVLTIKPEQDKWGVLFEELSQSAKIHGLNDQQWLALENKLLEWQNSDGFPKFTAEQIKQHKYFAVYFFKVANPNCSSILSAFIGKAQ